MSRHRLQNRWQQLSEPDIRRLQAEQLRRYLRTVVLPFSAYYRNVFQEHGLDAELFSALEDLQRLPFTTKSDLLNTTAHPQRFNEFILAPDARALARRPGTVLQALLRGRHRMRRDLESEFRPIFMTFTTGRSAEPTPFLYTRRDLAHLETAGRRVVEICAARAGDRLLNTLPFAPHLAFWLAHYAGTAGGVLTLSSGGGKVMGTEGTLRNIRKFKPDILIGVPTFVYHLLHQAAEEGVRCENLRRIVLGGEKASDGLRQKLRDLARESGRAARGCAGHLRLHGSQARLARMPFPATTSRPAAIIFIPISASWRSLIPGPARVPARPARRDRVHAARRARHGGAALPHRRLSLTAAWSMNRARIAADRCRGSSAIFRAARKSKR